jgi:hypothetical protein
VYFVASRIKRIERNRQMRIVKARFIQTHLAPRAQLRGG